MWLQRILSLIETSDGHVALEGDERYGADFVFRALGKRQRAAWVYFDAPDSVDATSQGNALAAALNRALGGNAFPAALPYAYHVARLKTQAAFLELRFILVSHPEFAPALTRSLLGLPASHCRVIVAGAPFDWEVARLGQDQLALRLDEARALSRAPAAEVEALLAKTGGAYAAFVNALGSSAQAHAAMLPGPEANRDWEGALVEPQLLLDALVREDRLLEALDVACAHVPERVAGLIAKAGPSYQERGLVERLFLNLRSLDERYLMDEAVLEWFLVAAVATRRSESALPLVDAYLASQPGAIALRARRVALEPDLDRRRSEARHLAELEPTPLTLFQWGSVCPDPDEGAAVLHAAVRLAERRGRPYEVVRNAGALARRLLHQGAYAKAASWAEWALRQCDRHQIGDGYRRLTIFNDHAYARLLLGRLANLREELSEAHATLDPALPELASLYRSTLSETELAHGNLDAALALAQRNVWQASRQFVGKYVAPLTRMLLEAGRLAEAEREAALASHVSAGEYFEAGAQLALGMVAAFRGAPSAAGLLHPIVEDAGQPAERRCAAALYYLWASGKTFASLPQAVRALFVDLSRSGLYVLSGPEAAFHEIWGQILGAHAPLRIRALGQAEVRLHGEPLHLSPTLLELLVTLALHPEGLGLEALQAHFYRDDSGKAGNLKMNLSRLRKYLPISSPPYQLELPYQLDVHECEVLIAQGRVQEALSLYRAPVLPESEAPIIEAWREQLEEVVRQAVLTSEDPEVLLDFARRARDLEVWERALDVLDLANDPRRVLARASTLRLRREYGLG